MVYIIFLFLSQLLSVIGTRFPNGNHRISNSPPNDRRINGFLVPAIRTGVNLESKILNGTLRRNAQAHMNKRHKTSLNAFDIKQICEDATNFVTRTIKSQTNASMLVCIVSAMAYIIPYIDVTQLFGTTMLKVSMPDFLRRVIVTSLNVAHLYSSIPFLSYVMFSVVYLIFVKKNQLNLHYFMRFNFLQSLIICAFEQVLSMLFLKLYPYSILDEGLIANVLFFTTISSSYGAILYSVALTLLGKYPLLPIISDAVKLHIGDPPSFFGAI